jgi:hypothetical protein
LAETAASAEKRVALHCRAKMARLYIGRATMGRHYAAID